MVSILTCMGVTAVWMAASSVATGRSGPVWHNVVDLSLAFGSAYALTATLVFLPAFAVLTMVSARLLTPIAAAAVGAALGPLALVAFVLLFPESESPQAVSEWLRYWTTHPADTAIGSLPFVIAGAVFGWSWARSENAVTAVRRASI
jgi:hypothetical protein